MLQTRNRHDIDRYRAQFNFRIRTYNCDLCYIQLIFGLHVSVNVMVVDVRSSGQAGLEKTYLVLFDEQ